MTNKEIIDANIGLIRRCVECQFAGADERDKEFMEDFYSDLYITLYEYDNDKMNDALTNNHFNALVSAIIRNNIWSKNSPYYKKYKRFADSSNPIETITEADEGGEEDD